MNNVKSIRRNKRISKEKFAELIDSSVYLVGKIESGEKELDCEQQKSIALVLGCEVEDVFPTKTQFAEEFDLGQKIGALEDVSVEDLFDKLMMNQEDFNHLIRTLIELQESCSVELKFIDELLTKSQSAYGKLSSFIYGINEKENSANVEDILNQIKTTINNQ